MKLINLIRNIVVMRNTELDDLARNIAFYDLAKAERLQHLLNVHVQEETDKRLKWKESV